MWIRLVIIIIIVSFLTGEEENLKRIDNSLRAINGQYPFVGGIFIKKDNGKYSPTCTATLLDWNTVLTAGHCFCKGKTFNAESLREYLIMFGSISQRDTLFRQVSEIKKVYVHKTYSKYKKKCEENITDQEGYYVYDVAVAKLYKSMKFSHGVKSVRLSQTVYQMGKSVTIAGFGFPNISYTSQLHYGQSKICKDYGIIVRSCKENDEDSSLSIVELADSGGPVITEEDKRLVQVGVILGGSDKDNDYLPSYRIYDWVYRNNQFNVSL